MVNIEQFRVNKQESVNLRERLTYINHNFTSAQIKEKVDHNFRTIDQLQQKLMAEEKEALIFALQALDAAGKDEAERYVFSKLSAQGLRTSSFSKPNSTELRHDYLWRLASAMPERGEIAVFNRSHYEEVIGARINQSHLEAPLPEHAKIDDIWQMRYRQINHFEQYLYENGFYMVKIFLHISKEIQKKRLLERIEDPNHQWEFSFSDLEDRERWQDHMCVFEECFSATSTKYAPWYIIPADDGDYGRWLISEILLDKLTDINPEFPKVSNKEKEKLAQAAEKLRNGDFD